MAHHAATGEPELGIANSKMFAVPLLDVTGNLAEAQRLAEIEHGKELRRQRDAEFMARLKCEITRTKELLFPPPPTPKPELSPAEIAARAAFRKSRHKLLQQKLQQRKVRKGS